MTIVPSSNARPAPAIPPTDAAARQAALLRLTGDELMQAFRLDALPRPLHPAARALLAPAARRFTTLAAQFDAHTATGGFQEASRWFLREMVPGGLSVRGAQHVPDTGPLLIVSNHPGQVDAMALLAHLPRADVRVLAAVRPLLKTLPAVGPWLIDVPPDAAGRAAALRAATRHLRAGGCVLTFPGGHIEPDPALAPAEADAALATWRASAEMFVRLVPGLAVQPALVSGVLAPSALAHPLARLYRARRNREWTAATLQMLRPRRHRATLCVTFGAPLAPTSDHAALLAAMRALVSTADARRG